MEEAIVWVPQPETRLAIQIVALQKRPLQQLSPPPPTPPVKVTIKT